MKILFSILIFLTFSFFKTFAQETPNIYRAQIDSVQTLLNKTSKSDTLRVIELNRLARLCIYDLQYERGLTAASEARELAQRLSYPTGEGLYLRTLDILRFDFANTQEQPYNILTYWSFYDLQKGENKIKIKSPDQVDKAKRKSQLILDSEALESKGNMEMAAHTFHLLAFTCNEEKNNEKALEYIEKAEGLFASLKLDIPLIESKLLKTKIFRQKGNEPEIRNIELQMASIVEKHEDDRERAFLYSRLGWYYLLKSTQIELVADYIIKSIQILENIGETYYLATVYYYAGGVFTFLELPQKSVEYLSKSFELRQSGKTDDNFAYFYMFYGWRLIDNNELEKAAQIFEIGKSHNAGHREILDSEGQLLMAKGQFEEAIEKYYDLNELTNTKRGEPAENSRYINYHIAYCFNQLGKLKESNRFALASYKQSAGTGFQARNLNKACLLLFDNYDKLGQTQNAYGYLKEYTEIVRKNGLQQASDRAEKMEIQSVINKSDREKEILKQEKILQEKANQTQRWWLFTIAAGLLSSLLVLYLLFRNNKNKQKANELLKQQKEEINIQKNNIEKTLKELKSTQSQLIQSEKMASLGELTAGIAHEIQNPLNFVNNFSEVSKELLVEMNEELAIGNMQLAKEIAGDIEQNLEKINHHGKRAADIVKGMLQHSRTSSGVKEPTDINALADEYLRLAYHGLRAKDKSFNADFQTEFDPTLPKINVIPQDIGRVILNLISNAFYAVNEKKQSNNEVYEPVVSIDTKKLGDKFEIKVRDNGNGIPKSAVDKIFQPFFTTKPTGQGTGLGLSLSYDIVKAHGGEIKVETKHTVAGTDDENVGTLFTVILPV